MELEFTVSEREGSGRYTEISFLHPETQILHTLYLQKEELERLPGDTPLWVAPILYEIRPPLSPGEELCFDSSISIPQTGDGFGFSPEATGSASIGIIGGADGPTAIFTGGLHTKELPRGTHGGSLHYTFAKPSRQPETEANVFLWVFPNKKAKRDHPCIIKRKRSAAVYVNRCAPFYWHVRAVNLILFLKKQAAADRIRPLYPL